MKIGIGATINSKSGYGRWNEKTYEKMKSHGFDAIDYNMAGTGNFIYTMPEEESNQILKNEKELALKSGIVVNQVHGPWRYPPRDLTDEDRKERMEKMKRSLRAANVLDCKLWVIHPIMPYGLEDIKENNAHKTWDLNLSFMREIVDESKKYDITVCIENMPFPDFSLSKPEDILKLVKELNDDNFKICLDTGHVVCLGDLKVEDEIRKLKGYIKAFHIHDSFKGHDYHLMPFNGNVNWFEVGKAIKEIEFDGVFSYETVPSGELPDELFEDACINLVKTAKYIVD